LEGVRFIGEELERAKREGLAGIGDPALICNA
jgi:hypothetical protein